MKLLLPLKHYDEAGRIKPNIGLYLALLFIARPLWVFIASFTFRQDSTKILELFYPDSYHFYLALSHAIPALVVLVLVSFREKIWAAGKHMVFALIPYLIGLSVCLDLLVQVYILNSQHFEFKVSYASSMLLLLVATLYMFNNKHLKLMLKDWRTS